MIVVAITLTERDARPLAAAAELARRLSEPLHLVHVHSTRAYALSNTTAKDSREQALIKLAALAKSSTGPGIEAKAEMLDGEVVAALSDCASRLRPRLMVIGGSPTRDDPHVNQLAVHLARILPCPFLVTGGDQNFVKPHLPARPLRVVVAIDDTRASDSVIAQLHDLRRSTPIDCTIVSLYWPPDEQRRRELPRLERGTTSSEVESAMKDDLAKRVGVLPGEGKVAYHVVPLIWHLGEHVAEEARQRDADFVLVGSHQRTALGRLYFGSMSEELVDDSMVSVLVAPLAAESPRDAAAEPRRVLVATDLSDAGNRAIAYACVYLRNQGGVLELLHVLNDASSARLQSATDQSLRPLGTSVDLARMMLEGLVPDVAKAYGLVTRVHVVASPNVAATIVAHAQAIKSDVICLTTQGRNAVSAMFVGSVSAEVVRMTSHPVLLVPCD